MQLFLKLLVYVLLLLVLAPGSTVQGEDGVGNEEDPNGDEEEETVNDWEDVLDALEPFQKEDGEPCAACSFVVQRINNKWLRHAYKLKKWSDKKKLKKARHAVKKACKGISKMQVCRSGSGKDTKFEDFNVLMQRGSISNVNMAGHYATDLTAFCNAVISRIKDFVPEKMAEVDRIFDYKMELDLCHRIIPVCGKKKLKSRNGASKTKSPSINNVNVNEVMENTMDDNEEDDADTIEL